MGLASVEVIATVPLSLWILVEQVTSPIYKWRGLGDLHQGFSRVDQWPAFVWRSSQSSINALEFTLWITVLMPMIFFAFFGVADEARNHYKMAISSVVKRVGLSTTWLESRTAGASSTGSKKGSSNFKITIPSFVQRRTAHHESVGSFTDKLSVNISIDDVVASDVSIKAPHLTYSPSEHSESSSTYLGSPIDEKATQNFHSEGEAPLPRPPQAYRMDVERGAHDSPDVPSSVSSYTVDMA